MEAPAPETPVFEKTVPEHAEARPWQRDLADAIRDPSELLALLGVETPPPPAQGELFDLP